MKKKIKKKKLTSITTISGGPLVWITMPRQQEPKLIPCGYCDEPTTRSSGICNVCIQQMTARN